MMMMFPWWWCTSQIRRRNNVACTQGNAPTSWKRQKSVFHLPKVKEFWTTKDSSQRDCVNIGNDLTHTTSISCIQGYLVFCFYIHAPCYIISPTHHVLPILSLSYFWLPTLNDVYILSSMVEDFKAHQDPLPFDLSSKSTHQVHPPLTSESRGASHCCFAHDYQHAATLCQIGKESVRNYLLKQTELFLICQKTLEWILLNISYTPCKQVCPLRHQLLVVPDWCC